ncbi:hypothetical protein MTO96_018941 [Rhipicephalus appendiculatus]
MNCSYVGSNEEEASRGTEKVYMRQVVLARRIFAEPALALQVGAPGRAALETRATASPKRISARPRLQGVCDLAHQLLPAILIRLTEARWLHRNSLVRAVLSPAEPLFSSRGLCGAAQTGVK